MKQNSKSDHQEFEDSTFCFLEQLFRLAYARVGNTQDAEDLLQETYLKAYRSFSTLRKQTRIKSWLTQILINTISDYRRKEMRALTTIDIDAMPDDVPVSYSQIGPEEQLCRDEIDPALVRALKAIPESFLIPLLLREIQEATYEEIAHVLDIPKGTVMSRLSRARALLRKNLGSVIDPNSVTMSGANDGQEEGRGLGK
jgi:RNA polymerase sigma-70 factor (ECF subfamily)